MEINTFIQSKKNVSQMVNAGSENIIQDVWDFLGWGKWKKESQKK